MNKERELTTEDAARIQCQTRGCWQQASMVHEVHWNTGNTKGVSFFYHCKQHRNNTRGD